MTPTPTRARRRAQPARQSDGGEAADPVEHAGGAAGPGPAEEADRVQVGHLGADRRDHGRRPGPDGTAGAPDRDRLVRVRAETWLRQRVPPCSPATSTVAATVSVRWLRLQRARRGDVVVVRAGSRLLTFEVDRVQLIKKREPGPRPALRPGRSAGAADRDLRWPLPARARGIPGQCRRHRPSTLTALTCGATVRPRVKSAG